MIWAAIVAAVLLAVALAAAGVRDDDEGGPGGLRRVRLPAAARPQRRSRR